MNRPQSLFAALPKLAKLAIWTALGMLASQPVPTRACDCFPPALRIKAAQDALQTAHVAVFGRVMVVSAAQGGQATVEVLESYKGPAKASRFEVVPGAANCVASALQVGETALFLAFNASPTTCDKYPPSHFLLEAFRANLAK